MSNFKKFLLIAGDVLLLYASLIATLLIRYETKEFRSVFRAHITPFSIIFIVWLAVFYLNDLYKNEFVKINYPALQKFLSGILINIVVSIIIFYLFLPSFALTPKTNLIILTAIFIILDLGWRFLLSKLYIAGGLQNRLLLIGNSAITEKILKYLETNPQVGYEVISHIRNFSEIEDLNQACGKNNIDTIVIQTHLKKDPKISKTIYKLLASKISILDTVTFYEMIFQKLAFEEMEESWFIEKIVTRRPIYAYVKRIMDIILSFALIIILSPLMLLIAVLIKTTSKGQVIYKQERVGLNNKNFILYKFRTMIANHSGPLATAENDSRITPIGKFLRHTHMDEVSQLFNILKGDISFIGPRAEASKLVEVYRQLPYYDLRHIIKPGLTGWAQINYKPSASLEEAKEKLRYDIYYIKNRSITLDFLILLKTIKYLFMSLK